jgi:hypothetical protein
MEIGIVTEQDGYNRGVSDFFPLIKWQKKFLNDGIKIRFLNSHKDKEVFNNDVIIIDHRYYRRLVVLDKVYNNRSFIIEFIKSLKRKGIKVILFDNDDGTGSQQWDLIDYVDVFVKKQILKDKFKYTENRGYASYMVFVDKYDLSKDKKSTNRQFKDKYVPCPEDQLHKIRLGWNIGMLDYRYFPLQKYFPFGTNRVLNSVYKSPSFNTDFDSKNINSSFRGKVREDNMNYSFQRNRLIQYLKNLNEDTFVTGNAIPKKKYLEELRRSKTCVSPFGWGEVCYRDFEAILAGAMLIKPDMSHLETYPNIYQEDKTYIPLKWDMSDLKEKVSMVIENYSEYKNYVYQVQQLYKNAINDYETFRIRFQSLVD